MYILRNDVMSIMDVAFATVEERNAPFSLQF